MSTRCQLVVETNERIKIYKHSDGYPSGVLPVLKKFLPAFKEGRGFDAEYLTAHLSSALIQDTFRGRRAFYRKMKKAHPKDPVWANRKIFQDFTGHGLDTQWHGDVEYVYRVKSDFSVEVYDTPSDMSDLSKAKLVKTYTLEELITTKKF